MSVVDCRLNPGLERPKLIKLLETVSPLSMHYSEEITTYWLSAKKMCPNILRLFVLVN